MIIADLDYLHADDDILDTVTGGLGFIIPTFASTGTIAVAQPGVAFANAQAIAVGQNAVTSSQTYASTSSTSTGSISIAYANASAFSTTGNGYVYSQTTSIAVSISNFIPIMMAVPLNRSTASA